jgi:putative aldouronate transport system substrate-binding protein
MKKKLLLVVFASLLAIGTAGCNNNNSNANAPTNESATQPAGNSPEPSENATASQINFDEEPYTIKVNYAVLGQEQPDLPKIEAKVNEITLKEINAKVDLEGVSLYNMANVYALKASSGEKTDLMLLMPGYHYLVAFANNNMIRPIDEELAKWGPTLNETLGDFLLAGQFKGKQYAIPQQQAFQNTIGFWFSQAILDKYKIDISNIKSVADMDPIFATVHASEPNMIMIAPDVSSSNITDSLIPRDGLGNQYGVLMNDGSTKIINIFETEKWINTAKKAREWYQKGYISKDVNTSQDDGAALVDNGKVFTTAANSIGFQGGTTVPSVKKTVALYPPESTTSDSQLFLWTVATSSKRPDKAIQFLNLLNSSKELTTLLQYGIEGDNYDVVSDGVVDTSKNKNFESYWPLFGDVYKAPISDAYIRSSGLSVEEYKTKQKEWIDNTKKSVAYGFVFDSSSVKTEIAALDAVTSQYNKVIGNGAVDTEEMLKKFNEALYAAGLQKVIDAKQSQLDAWLASKGK